LKKNIKRMKKEGECITQNDSREGNWNSGKIGTDRRFDQGSKTNNNHKKCGKQWAAAKPAMPSDDMGWLGGKNGGGGGGEGPGRNTLVLKKMNATRRRSARKHSEATDKKKKRVEELWGHYWGEDGL